MYKSNTPCLLNVSFRCRPRSAEASWGAVPQHPQWVRHHRGQGSVSGRWASPHTLVSWLWGFPYSFDTCNPRERRVRLPPVSPLPHLSQVRSVCPAPAVWSTLWWLASQRPQGAVRPWPLMSCSTYWELVRWSRGAHPPPASWSRVLPRRLLTPLMWVVVSFEM